MFYIGLGIFLVAHMIPLVPSLKESLTDEFGATGYKIGFSVASLVGIVMIAMGFDTNSDFLYDINVFAYNNANGIVTVAFILVLAAYMPPSYIKKFTRHPMSLGVAVWASFHLSVNPDIESVFLFGSLLIFVVTSAVLAEVRGTRKEIQPKIYWDIATVVVGMVVSVLAGMNHQHFTGVPLM